MQTKDVPLLENFETYLKTLPTRKEKDSYVYLYTHEYLVRPIDLTNMAIRISEPNKASVRSIVKYISSPSASGKTSSVLPAFMESTKFEENGGSYYIYIAFSNNDGRSFKCDPPTPSYNHLMAEKQGAAFIVQCIKNLLERSDDMNAYEITLSVTPPTVKVSEDQLNMYLQKKLRKNCSVWFHIDEHQKMCDRSSDSKGGAYFSRGAMQTLAQVPNARVIATYTDLPREIPVKMSSVVCRIPIPLPLLDVDQLINKLPQLKSIIIIINNNNSNSTTPQFNTRQQRLFASLKLRLGIRFRRDVTDILYHRDSTMNKFLNNFQICATTNDSSDSSDPTTFALKKCIQLCDIKFSNEFELLISVNDNTQWINDERIDDIVVLPNNKLTVSIDRLLQNRDSKVKLYDVGKTIFLKNIKELDLISNAPLEAAYYWALSCLSAVTGELKLSDENPAFLISCQQLMAGRLFPNSSSNVHYFNGSFLQKGKIYYADERSGKPTHPLADMFFLTDDNRLVLIDITDGDNYTCANKVEKLKEWIIKNQPEISYILQGVVLAPNVSDDSFMNTVEVTNDDESLLLICGSKAIGLLGGLGQIAQWLIS
jgi:hypothetical protein